MAPEPQPTCRQEEIESISRISKLIVEEVDPARFKVLVSELDELLRKEQERRARQTHAPKYRVFSASLRNPVQRQGVIRIQGR